MTVQSAKIVGHDVIGISRLSGGGGAEISGVDLSKPMIPEVWAAVKQAFLDHHVLVFRDQTFTAAQQYEVGSRFGVVTETPLMKQNGDGTASFVRDADASPDLWNYGNYWHFDGPYAELPPRAVLLYSVDCPPYGGDTMFSNVGQAYDALSPKMKDIADQLVVLYSAGDLVAKLTPTRSQSGAADMFREPVEHPLVCLHPETGRKTLLISGDIAVGIKGMTKQESRPILDFLHRHAHREEFTIRVRWEKGTATLWDNRALQHFAVDDYYGFRREMRRVEIGGAPRPEGPATVADRRQVA